MLRARGYASDSRARLWYNWCMVHASTRTVSHILLVALICAFAPVFSFVAFGAETPGVRADSVVIYTNIERHAQGVPLLRTSGLLSEVAERKMRDMFARQYFAHDAPTGEDVSDLADAVGYEFLAIGENLAVGDFTSSKHVVRSWMESPGHRKNILAEKYTEIGVAAGRGSYKGKTMWMVVQSFGLPRTSCPPIDETMRSDLDLLQAKITILDKLLTMRKKMIDTPSISKSVRSKYIPSYNNTVKLYNEHVERYRELLRTYNDSVDAFNMCLAKKVGA